MKKLVLLIFTLLVLIGFSGTLIATSGEVVDPTTQVENGITENIENVETEENLDTEEAEMSPAGEEIVGAVTEKDRKIATLTDKYNDRALATVAYYLEIVRYYSTPIFFIFLTIGAFNFFIVGNKKLDKKEQGFGWITACIIGWVFFQCIPLAFALFAIK